ncbi:hypothetical protein PUNSTDRAFT_51782 [Punctularia strigosozonata HHB-11173 SS5]|uniref:uncharacterized protein n=1 Tax=Punctularia strigosozonata (strain HHB-11173) TaxID=741275 RepID=UPI0004416954|nr:uncharacterized protein PUNSTDRAFT_51782 [Punctularia strigosozonata HHB-11173 SS5]EIN09543.1 hypothetical protein PUNSTDRAFT_51782 [Punctularia strigosozonata HHB-11173 SS5]
MLPRVKKPIEQLLKRPRGSEDDAAHKSRPYIKTRSIPPCSSSRNRYHECLSWYEPQLTTSAETLSKMNEIAGRELELVLGA